MYQMNRPVTYSDVGPDYKTDIAQIIDYFQDCSCFHSDSVGVGMEYMENEGKAWVLNSWQIIVERYPKYGETITVGTWPYSFRGPVGMRNFVIDDSDGKRLVRANSVWAMLDVRAGRPARIDTKQMEAYPIEPKEPMAYAGRKIPISGAFEILKPVSVTKSYLDTNHHMNNGQYVAVAMEYLPEDFQIHEIRAEYKHSACRGDKLIPKRQVRDGEVTIVLEDVSGETYVNLVFIE